MPLTPLELLSMLAFVLLLIGYVNRRRTRVHIPIMVTAFMIDMAIVVFIELSRGAIDRAQTKMGALMLVHIGFSIVTIVLYITQIVTGVRRVRRVGGGGHGRSGIALLACRFGNLVTALLVMQ